LQESDVERVRRPSGDDVCVTPEGERRPVEQEARRGTGAPLTGPTGGTPMIAADFMDVPFVTREPNGRARTRPETRRETSMTKRPILVLLAAATLAAGPARAAKLELLNVSYDPTRELWR